jgi:hypothetical protein
LAEERGATVKTSNAIAAWNKADLIFLMDALKRGVGNAYVAKILGRSEDEVREQANALKRRRLPRRPATPQRGAVLLKVAEVN